MSLRELVSQEISVNKDKDSLALLVSQPVNNSALTKAIQDRLAVQDEEKISKMAEHAIDLLSISEDKRNSLIEHARLLRSEAKKYIAKAEALYNAEQTLLQENRIAPLAHLTGKVVGIDSQVADGLKDYYSIAKKAGKAKLSEVE